MDTQAALRALYDLLVEYDLQYEIEDAANAIDRRRQNELRDEYARVIGIFIEVRAALGIEDGQAWEI